MAAGSARGTQTASADRDWAKIIDIPSAPFLEDGTPLECMPSSRLIRVNPLEAATHLLLAEQACSVVPGISGLAGARPIHCVGVVGASPMGTSVALTFADAGIPTILADHASARLGCALKRIETYRQTIGVEGHRNSEEIKARSSQIVPATDFCLLRQCDLVIEANTEDLTGTLRRLQALDRVCHPKAVLAIQASVLDVNEVAKETRRPDAVVGLNFSNPGTKTRLVEIARADRTAPWAWETVVSVAKKIGKIPVAVAFRQGLVGDRMFSSALREANHLLEDGAVPQQVDQALLRFGITTGPLAMADAIGLDSIWRILKLLEAQKTRDLRPSIIVDRLCKIGRFGRKTGSGYYRYDANRADPYPDTAVEEVLWRCRREAGIERRSVSDQEIVDRIVLALINEASYILEDGACQRSSDIDVACVAGYGFPKSRGGPMFYVDSIGADVALERISAWQTTLGERWRPSKLFGAMVRTGRRFCE